MQFLHGVLLTLGNLGIWLIPLTAVAYCCGRYMGFAGIIFGGILISGMIACIQLCRLLWDHDTSVASDFIFLLGFLLIQSLITNITILPASILGWRIRARNLPQEKPGSSHTPQSLEPEEEDLF